MNIVEFVNNNDTLWFPININGKTITGWTNSYHDFTNLSRDDIEARQEKNKSYPYVMVDTRFRQIIDLDIPLDQFKTTYPHLYDIVKDAPYYLSRNKRYPHFFVNFVKDKPNKKVRYGIDKNFDVLCGQSSFVLKQEEVINAGNELPTVKESDIHRLPVIINNDDQYGIKTICENFLHTKYYDHYGHWMRIGYIYKKAGFSDIDFDLFSKKSTVNYKGFNDVKEHYGKINDQTVKEGEAFDDLLILIYQDGTPLEPITDLIHDIYQKKFNKYDNNWIRSTPYQFRKIYIEKNHCCITNQDTFLLFDGKKIIDEKKKTEFISYADSMFGEKWIANQWLLDPHRRKYNKVECLPDIDYVSTRTILNTYERAWEPLPENQIDMATVNQVNEHLKYLCEDSDASKEFVIKLLAHALKYGSFKTHAVALMFRSKAQRIGKNIFWYNFLKNVFGGAYVVITNDGEMIFEKHSDLRKDQHLIVFDEANGSDHRGKKDRMKNYITESEDNFNPKGLKFIRCYPSFNRWIYLTNNDNPVEFDLKDERYTVFNIKYRKPDSYYQIIGPLLTNNLEAAHSYFSYLWHYDIDKHYNFQKNRPLTSYYQTLKSTKVPNSHEFLRYFYEQAIDGLTNNNEYNIRTAEFYKNYKDWCREEGYDATQIVSNRKLPLIVSETEAFSKQHHRSGDDWVVDLKLLSSWLVDNNLISPEHCLIPDV